MKETLKTALHTGGKVLINYFGKLNSYEQKENQSNIVTQVDIDSEKAIIKIIASKFPGHNIIAEESGFNDKNSTYTWIIDPLDGTSNFAAGLPWFGVIICILKESKPVMAGIYLPVSNLLYFAEKGKGAGCNNKPILVSNEKKLQNILMCYSLDYSEDISKTENELKIIGKLVQNTRNLRATNSVFDFCYTADGRIGACMNQTAKIWDIAAPYLIINEADGVVTDKDGNDMDFNVNRLDYQKNFTIVAANPVLHSKIMQLIN